MAVVSFGDGIVSRLEGGEDQEMVPVELVPGEDQEMVPVELVPY